MEFYEQITVQLPNIKFRKNPFNNSLDVSAYRQGDGVTDVRADREILIGAAQGFEDS
jgi:hypothetical protein